MVFRILQCAVRQQDDRIPLLMYVAEWVDWNRDTPHGEKYDNLIRHGVQ